MQYQHDGRRRPISPFLNAIISGAIGVPDAEGMCIEQCRSIVKLHVRLRVAVWGGCAGWPRVQVCARLRVCDCVRVRACVTASRTRRATSTRAATAHSTSR